jgi:DNA polymerase-3 subunit delta'
MARAEASAASQRNGTGPMPVVQPDGALPLPWLDAALDGARRLAGAHALLIHGPAGVGHFECAVLLAQSLLCEAGAAGTGWRRACGRCASCHLVAQRTHPDLRLVLPAVLRVQQGWTDEDDYIAPKGEAKPSRDLRIDQVRAAIDWSQQTSGRGRGKVLVLHPAQALNTASANALLKTLEEPPGAVRILLTCPDPEHLLPTVRSRCQRLALALPPADDARGWLQAQGLDAPDALLALAGGSPLEALAWAQEGWTPAMLAGLPRRVAAGDASVLQGRSVPRVVELLLKLAHDAQVQSAGGTPRFFDPAQMPRGADLGALRGWQQALLRVARHDEHPWSAALLVESLVTQGAAVWAATRAERAARPGPSLHSAR